MVISKWILCSSIILALTPLCLCEMDLFNLIGTQPKTYSGGDPCLVECQCYDKQILNQSGRFENRFIVNCTTSTGMIFVVYEADRIPLNIPKNTTDMIISGYKLGTLGIDKIPHSPLPLHPFLLSVSLRNCQITFLSPGYILENSNFHLIDLSDNFLKTIEQDTFSNLQLV